MKKLILISVMVLMGSLSTLADAKERVIEFSIKNASGNFVAASMDHDMDGVSASYSTLNGKSRQLKSSVIANILSEARAKLDQNGIPVLCQTAEGNTGIELELVKARGDYRLNNGDHFFTEAVSLQACADLSSCIDDTGRVKEGCRTHTVVKGIITGGTGRFACATGEIEDESTGLALSVDPKGDVFGSILDSTVEGKIRIPSSCKNN